MLRLDRLMLCVGLVVAPLVLVACGDDDGEPETDAGTGSDAATDAGGSDDAATGTDGGGPTTCGGSACELPAGTGCADAADGCYYLVGTGGAPAAECVAAGTAAGGAACMFPQDCVAGHHCDLSGGGAMGVCRQLCCWGSDEACPGDERCATRFLDGADNPTDVGFCSPPDDCSLVDQTGCEAGEGCYPLGDDGARQCRSAGAGAPGAACGGATGVDCAAGSGCYAIDGAPMAQCYVFCATADPSCAAGQICNPFPAPDDAAGICIASP